MKDKRDNYMLKAFFLFIQKRSFQHQYSKHKKICQRHKQKGQILLEYILLITIVIFIARALIEGLVLRDQDNEGVVIKHWIAVSEIIAEDEPN